MLAFFRRIRKAFVISGNIRKYIIYAIGEIALVVIGILIALQVNNWNQIRIENDRFDFGMKQIHSEILASKYYQGGLSDKLNFQLARIDSLLLHPNEMPLSRIPPIIILFDQYGLDIGREWGEKTQFLKINPSNKKKTALSVKLQYYLDNINREVLPFESIGLYNVMSKYLRSFDIPIKVFNHGPTYEEFIETYIEDLYSPSYDDRIKALLVDESFRADLITLRQIKRDENTSARFINLLGDDFLQYIQSEVAEIDYSLKYLEVIGSGTEYDDWSQGVPMKKISNDGTQWEIELYLKDGAIKFRSDIQWVLDWGRSEDNKDKLVFKGGDIEVSEGFYRITIDISESTYQIIPLSKNE